MLVNGKQYRTIWPHPEKENIIQVIDQRWLPHKFITADLKTLQDVCTAIKEMWVRGAPLIGAAAAWGMYLSTFEMPENNTPDAYFKGVYKKLMQTRPTAVNLKRALDEMLHTIAGNNSLEECRQNAKIKAEQICDEDVEINEKIGGFGFKIIEDIFYNKGRKQINILTHCNAGWLATVDRGTATSPVYLAVENKIPVHIYVSETRPRNQGSQLTAWELLQENIPHTLITDSASGYLMQTKKIDMVIVGTDRTTSKGDVVNKTGTYLKALAAKENNIPFYVAVPSPSIDWNVRDAFLEIPIEERNENEIKYMQGLTDNEIKSVLISPENTPAANFAFDITPAKYITGLITERGICLPNETALLNLFPEKKELR